MKTIENIKIVGRSQMIFDLIERNDANDITSTEIVFAPFDRVGANYSAQATSYIENRTGAAHQP